MKKVLTFLIVILFTVVSIKAEQTQTIDEKVKDNSNKYQEIQIPDRRGTNDFREATKGMKYDQPAIGVENGVYKDGTTGVTGIYTQDGLRYQIQINIGWKANGGPENATKMAKEITTGYANVLKLYAMDNSVEKLNEICDKYGDRDGNGVLGLEESNNLFKHIRKEYNMPKANGYELIEYLKEKVQKQSKPYKINKIGDHKYRLEGKINGTKVEFTGATEKKVISTYNRLYNK